MRYFNYPICSICSICPIGILALLLCAMAVVAQPAAESPRRPADAVIIDDIVLPALPKGKTRDDFLRDHKITTRKSATETITEHRLNGKLYRMEVKPDKGPAYTLIDEKGEGKFVRMGEVNTKIAVPMWVLLTW